MKKYEKILQDLYRKIETHHYKTNDRLPSEHELCELYDVSRMTVNRALTQLAQEGFIKRTAGKGSYVCERTIKKNIESNRSFSDDMKDIGCVAGSELIDYRVFRAKDLPELAKRMQLHGDDFIHYFVRLRTGDGVPIAINYTYISSEYIPAFDIAQLSSSLYAYLEEKGMQILYGDGLMTAVMASEDQKEILEVSDCALLKNAHYSYLKNGKAIEYTETYYIGSRYTYHYHFDNSQ